MASPEIFGPLTLARRLRARLGEVTNYGITEKSEPGEVDDDTWVLELEDVEKITSNLLKRVRYSERPFRSSKNRFVADDVLYGKLRPYLDKVLVADEAGVCTTEIIPIRGYGGIEPTYLRYSLKAPNFTIYANESAHGMNLPRLGTDKARLALIPLAPTAEQHRIVTKVDELMTLCDQLEQQQTDSIAAHQTLVETLLGALTTASDQKDFEQTWQRIADHFDTLFTTEHSIDQLKQTILQLAIMGKLVPQDPNDAPAKCLLREISEKRQQALKERYPNEAESKTQQRKQEKQKVPKTLPPLPSGWVWATLMQCSLIVVDCHNKTAPYEESGIALLRTSNIRNGELRHEGIKYVSDKTFERWAARTTPQPGDILITREAPMGEVCVLPDDQQYCMGQRIMLIRLVPQAIDPLFMLVSLRDPDLMERVQDKPVGMTVQHLRVGGVETLLVPVPPLSEQHRIVTKVNELITLCDTLKSRLQPAQTTQTQIADAIVKQAVA